MATDWNKEMTDRFDDLQRALTEELRKQFATMGEQLETRLEERLGAKLEARIDKRMAEAETRLEERLGARLEARIDKRLLEAEDRLTGHISKTIQVQVEALHETAKTIAANYGGVLDGIQRELRDFRDEWRKKTEDTDLVLADHNARLVKLERRQPPAVQP